MKDRKTLLLCALLIIAFFLAGCAAALLMSAYDARSERIRPMEGGQLLDLSAFGFTLMTPEGWQTADYTDQNHESGGAAVFPGCTGTQGSALYIFCYDNENGDSLENYAPKELFRYYMSAGAQDVRLRTLGGRRFIEYSALVQREDKIETWFTYETWDAARQITFETQIPARDVLPILATITFTE